MHEKPPTTSDSASDTLKSVSQSMSKKYPGREVEVSIHEGSQLPPRDVSLRDGKQDVTTSSESDVEVTRIRTSSENVEYPTGVKLNLISLALCLSVFLVALVRV